MKIIYTSAEDFLLQEIAEYGEDYVDRQFDLGFEPGLVTALGQSFYTWVKVDNVLRSVQGSNSHSHLSVSHVSNSSVSVAGHLA